MERFKLAWNAEKESNADGKPFLEDHFGRQHSVTFFPRPLRLWIREKISSSASNLVNRRAIG